MKILIAPAPYKECLDARTVADAIEMGARQIYPEAHIVKLPVCDGGTGLIDRLIEAKGGRKVFCWSHDPLMNSIESPYGILPDGTAVIESATAAGLALVSPQNRNPLKTTSFGVGDIINSAVNNGCRKLLIGCGDSAVNDGGVGMAKSLGVQFRDSRNNEIGMGGQELSRIHRINLSSTVKMENVDVTVACNITSILCGKEGTSHKYAKQKGADETAIELLEGAMMHYADVLTKMIGWDPRYAPGTGAAGGLGVGLLVFANAKLRYSMGIVCEALEIEQHIQTSDLIITGEGMADGGSATGKAMCAIGLLGKKHNVPSVAIVGSISADADIVCYHGIDLVEGITSVPMSIEDALDSARAKVRIMESTVRVLRFIKRNDVLATGGKNGA